MRTLAPNLFQRRFQDFVEMGRARLPSLAPDWTDHNAHDPGITLMELLAWVAEAQLYSLSRMRRDERAAYAALLGIAPHGTQSATGLIWPDRLDPNSPAATFEKTIVLPEDTVINTIEPGSPTFRPVQTLLWVPGRIVKLETRSAKGRTTDHTVTNARGGLPFYPFGEKGGRRNVLALTFECRDTAGLFGKDRDSAKGAYWPIGFLAAPPIGGATETSDSPKSDRSTLEAVLVTDNDRIDLPIAADTTNGLLATGTLLLDLDGLLRKLRTDEKAPGLFTVELRSRTRLSRPPRLLRVEPNVIPIKQEQKIARESKDATGEPDFSFGLKVSGLRFAAGDEPLKLEVAIGNVAEKWELRERLSECGPDDNVYELDAAKNEITFGNGVNGRVPQANSTILVTYSVSDGPAGRVARNRKWKVAGFGNTFGVNPDPITGGGASSALLDDRREARRRVREDHALISSADIETAAKNLPLLEVARTWVPDAPNQAPRTGVVPLVALRSRPGGEEPEQAPETAEWLNEIRRQLSPQMPLGLRLMVAAPRYVEFFITAVIEANAGLKPEAVKQAVENKLKQKLALVGTANDVTPRPPGVPVTVRDVGAWLRAAEGVKRVNEFELRGADGQKIDKEVTVPRNGLPRCLFGRNSIEVNRPNLGRLG
jgi:hypothetical protein